MTCLYVYQCSRLLHIIRGEVTPRERRVCACARGARDALKASRVQRSSTARRYAGCKRRAQSGIEMTCSYSF